MKTTFHSYFYDLRKPEEKQQYEALCKKLQGQGLICFSAWGGKGSFRHQELDGLKIELETKFLFDNQWNTAPISELYQKGLRVFDWAEDYHSRSIGLNPNLKIGHWLEQTDEMRQARVNRVKCGYCGKQYHLASKPPTFCDHCLQSKYLKESDLYLLRLRSVMDKTNKFPPLTEKELADLLPKYLSAQLKGKEARTQQELKDQREYVEKILSEAKQKAKQLLAVAEIEYQGKKWLIEHGVTNLRNVIYYDHTHLFSFGWMSPYSPIVKAELEKLLTDFPYPYEFAKEKK